MRKTTIYLPNELALMVGATAKQTGVSKASVIREAVTAYMATREWPMPTCIGSVEIDGVEGADTEEWLLANWHPD